MLKMVGEFLNPWGSLGGPSQLALITIFWIFPLEGKNWLALWGQADAEEGILEV